MAIDRIVEDVGAADEWEQWRRRGVAPIGDGRTAFAASVLVSDPA